MFKTQRLRAHRAANALTVWLKVIATLLLTIGMSLVALPAQADSASGYLTATGGQVVTKAVGASRLNALTDFVLTVPSSLPATLGFQLRSSATSSGYRAIVRIAADGSVTSSFSRVVNSVPTTLGTDKSLGFAVKAGQQVEVRAAVTDTAKVNLYLSAWKVGATKPSQWQAYQADSSTQRITSAGVTRLLAFLPTGAATSTVNYYGWEKEISVTDAAKIGVTGSTSTTTTTAAATTTSTTTTTAVSGSTYGVPTGTVLTKRTGDLVITQPGTVISNLDLDGYIWVKADNVTIKNSILRGGATATSNRALVMSWNGAKNLKVVDSTLRPRYPSVHTEGVSGSEYVVDGLDVSGVVDAVKVIGSNVTVKNSWLHDAYYKASGAGTPDGQTHNDAVQVEGGSNIVITGNKMDGYHNTAIMVTQNASLINGLVVDSNELSGGQCTVNMAEKGKGPLQGVKFRYNKFGANLVAGWTCPIIYPTTTTVELTSNTWLLSGLLVAARKG